ncbi:hypothetical protein [Sulfurospirillum oryzae]|uniref:hypothetical protein n=1 Tax=Sulfurospirillum oryzae TaxID=2976535 RepID=UPI0021E8A536|nr:hypothetical protein [Sulfurospirillum oryzae]
MPIFLMGFFTALTDFLLKLLGKKGVKLAFFTVYTALLIAVMNGVANFALNHVDVSSFMTPTICWFLMKLKAFSLLSTYFAFMSANWLKRKMVQFWTYGN